LWLYLLHSYETVLVTLETRELIGLLEKSPSSVHFCGYHTH
jgi:hypothetical protein